MYAAPPGITAAEACMSDWTTEAADKIVSTIGLVRDRTVEPVQKATHVVVFALVAALIVIPALILASVGAFRALVILYQGEVWAAWLTLGGIFVLAGGFCWTKRTP